MRVFSHMVDSSSVSKDDKKNAESKKIIKTIAGNPNTPQRVLRKISEKDDDGAESVAGNAKVDSELQGELARSSSSGVRAALTENPNLDAAHLEKLINDEDPTVRHRLAENANLPRELLIRLKEDENPYVAARAEETLARLDGGGRGGGVGSLLTSPESGETRPLKKVIRWLKDKQI